MSPSSVDLIGVVSGSGTYSELNLTVKFAVWTLTSPSSMACWLITPMISETTGLVLEWEVLYLKWAAGGWMLHSLGSSFGSSPWRALNWFVFLIRIGGRDFGPRMMQASALRPILPQHLQIVFCLVRRAAITGWRDYVSLLIKYEELKWREHWPEVVNVVGAPIISI